jgi:PAS domain S-box-containing protein
MLAANRRGVWVRDIVTLSPQDGSQMLRGRLIDITETKRTEQALALSEQKFSSAFHSGPDIIVLLDQQDGRFLAVNSTFEQKLGISAVEAIGRTGTELGLWAEQGSGPRIQAMLHEGHNHIIESNFQRRDGIQFTALLSAQKVTLYDNRPRVVAVRDVSELKDTQQRLKLSEDEFAKAFHASPVGLLITRLHE